MVSGDADQGTAPPAVGGVVAPTPQELARRLAHPSIRAPLAIALTDVQGRVQWVNSAFSRQTGYPPAAVIGRDRLELFRGPVTRSGELGQIRDSMAAGEPIEREFQTWTRSGQPYWVSCVVAPSLHEGRVESFVFAEEDITQRRRTEDTARSAIAHAEGLADALREERELLGSVVATIPHVVFWKDADYRYLGCNDAYLRLRGVGTAADLVGLREQDLPPSDELAAIIHGLEEQVADTGREVIDHPVVIPGPAGGQRTLLLSILPRCLDGQTTDGVIGVGADVTRATELERQLAQATRLESIGQLAAGLAHEINTPVQYISDNVLFLADSVNDMLDALRSIAALLHDDGQVASVAAATAMRLRLQALVDRLDLGFLAAEIPSSLEQTLEGVGRVGQIVRAMKEFSHPGQNRAPTDLNRAVETTVQISLSEWKYVAELQLDLDPGLGLVPCYEGELKQVVLNLIVNAAHAVADRRSAGNDTGLGRIDVATRREEHHAIISVSDDGCGMDTATQQRIYDPFFTTKEVGKGTGQGLSMAHSIIVGKHGGSIDVHSAPGHGSTFTIRLPLTDPDPTPPPIDGVTEEH